MIEIISGDHIRVVPLCHYVWSTVYLHTGYQYTAGEKTWKWRLLELWNKWQYTGFFKDSAPVPVAFDVFQSVTPGGRLNKKDGLISYGDFHVKDKTS